MAQPKFDVSPEKEAQVTSYFHRQLSFTPKPVENVNLQGKTAIVTGSNTGLGLECSRQLLDLGITRLILAVRSETKGQAAVAELTKGREMNNRSIEVWHLDLLSYESVKAFGDKAERELEQLDIVILNAGILPIKQVIDLATGHDEGIQVNYLSTVLLLVVLLPTIKEKYTGSPCRVTLVSSDGAGWTPFKEKANDPLLPSFDKPDGWSSTDRNFVAKLLTQFFVTELVKSVPSSLAIINMATPGMVHDSEMSRHSKTTLLGRVAEVVRRRVGSTSAVAACLIIDAAVNHGEESHGQYFSEQRLKPLPPIIYKPEGKEISKRIWTETLAEFSSLSVDVNNILERLK